MNQIFHTPIKTIVIFVFAGIGDNVHLEPGIRYILSQGIQTIHLFTRPDAIGIYDNYAGVIQHSNQAKHELIYWLNHCDAVVDIGGDLHHDHTLHRCMVYANHLCDTLGIKRPDKLSNPQLILTDDEKRIGKRFLGLRPGQKSIVFQIDSFRSTKSLPMDIAATVIKSLLREHYKVFYIANETLPFRDRECIRLVGLPIRKLMCILASVDVVFGMDSAPSLLSSSVGGNTVALFGSTDPSLYAYDNIDFITDSTRYSSCGKIKCSSPICMTAEPNFLLSAICKKKLVIDDTPKNIAIIRIRGIGDILLSLPAVASMKALHPDWHITYITSVGISPILELCKYIDKVVPVEYNHPTSGLPEKPHGVSYSNYDRIYNLINRIDFIDCSRHVPRTELFGKFLGVEVDYSLNWKITLPDEWRYKAEDILKQHGWDGIKPLACIQTQSMGIARQWHKVRWLEVARLLYKDGLMPVILSNIKDNDIPDEYLNLTGDLTLVEFFSVISTCSIFIGTDTSGIHIAGVLNRKGIGIYGAVGPSLRVAHYASVLPITSNLRCSPCNDWQLRTCEDKPHCPECTWRIRPSLIVSHTHKILEENHG